MRTGLCLAPRQIPVRNCSAGDTGQPIAGRRQGDDGIDPRGAGAMGDPARGARRAGRRCRLHRGAGLAPGPAGRPRTPRQPHWYTPGEAAALFEALDRLDAGARTVYAATGLTIDMAFPAAYGLLFAILLVRLFRAPFFLLPLATAAADVLENAAVAALALSYAGAPSPLAWLAAAFTLVKALSGYAGLAATCVGAVRWLWRRRRR